MKRILVYGLSNGFGGVETILLNIMKYSDKAILQFDFIVSAGQECLFAPIIEANGGKIHRVKPWGQGPIRHKNDLKMIFSQEQPYDYVWINTASASNISMQLATRQFSDAKIIVHCHGMGFEPTSYLKEIILRLLHNFNYKKFLRLTDLKFACSKKAGAWLFGQSGHDHRNMDFDIINNGIEATLYKFNLDTRDSARATHALADSFVLIHIGRICKVKNHLFLIKIFSEVCKQRSNSVLLIVGNGEMKAKVEQAVAQQNLADKVLFLGERKDVAELLQAADVFILPSLSEGLPLTLLEAQAAGLPSVVSDVIPMEANVTNLVDFISIESQASVWATAILRHAPDQPRRDTYPDLVRSGFDISSTAQKVEGLLASPGKPL